MIIYQVLTRLFGNNETLLVPNGTKEQNGCGKMSDFTLKALEEIRSLGATHIWYTGIIEHATQTDYTSYGISPDHPDVVKGKAGSAYAIKDYYDVDPDLAEKVPARMKEFQNLVARSHKAGLKVIIDFVPNHVARQYHSDVCPEGTDDLGVGDDTNVPFSNQNNFYYLSGEALHLDNIKQGSSYSEFPAKATGNDVFCAWPGCNDWYETVKLNYGIDVCAGRVGHFSPVPDTWHKMLNILLFWAEKGIDGFRCDMAEMVPVEFWEWVIPQVKVAFPDILFIAEVYNPAEYRNYIHRGHFDYLYDKVGLYDTLKAVAQGSASAQSITSCWQQTDDIRMNMLNFLENHDEQRIASDFFVGDARKGRAPLLVSALMYKNPFMVYFGQELGERGMDEEGFSGRDGRTTIFDYWTVDTIRRWRNKGTFDGKLLSEEELLLRKFYASVLRLKEQEIAFSNGDFFDLMYQNPHLHQQYVFARKGKKDVFVIVANFFETDQQLQIDLPRHLFELWKIKEKECCSATNMLTGKRQKIDFSSEKPFCVSVPALCGVVLKIGL
ncbi:MAG: alpha-amylase family protein [Bacteroidaceae bacterium]|nr:alpha-amylase family protein [Bacteroidaceae bacterium]